jgi:uncharacterized cupin superfamily protein
MHSMSRALSEVANTASNLTPGQIEPSWIIEGNPVTQWSLLSKSADWQAWTMIWQCSEGKFNWYYDCDETVLILEGSVVIENETMPPTRFGPGDVIYFKNGAHAEWHVECYVRKLAFLRSAQPMLVALGLRVLSKIKRTLKAAWKTQAVSL